MPIWIGQQLDTHVGQEGSELIQQHNDAKYFGPEGVVAVDHQRWLEAQNFERAAWDCQIAIHGSKAAAIASRDRDAQFSGYAMMPSQLGDVIEVGCGPFTQLVPLLTGRQASSVTVLDPLAEHYMDNIEYCAFRHGRLLGQPVTVLSQPAEEFREPNRYDTLMLINVLEHVQDAKLILANCFDSIKPGGWIIFADKSWDGLQPLDIYDTGHPIRVTSALLQRFCGQFEPVFSNSLPDSVYEYRWIDHLFVGRKPA